MAFKDVLGQEKAINILKKTITQNRVPEAYLFCGPDGVGKIKTAKEVAKVCNCQGLKEGDSCDVCSSCYKINHDIHPDVKVIKPASLHFLITQIQDLQKEVYISPYEGKKKVYILDEVNKMTTQAANAFLKTLEEPSPTTLFILISNSGEILLPTIISRCQPVKFNLIPFDIQTQVFAQWGVTPTESNLLTQASGGSIGKAKEYLEKDVFVHQKKITELMENLFKREEGFLLISKMVSLVLNYYKKEDIYLFLEILPVWLKETFVDLINVSMAIDIIIETQKILKFRNANLQLAMEVMFLKLKECLTK